MDLDIKVYQAERAQMLKDAAARKKDELAAANARFAEEKAAADLFKKEQTAALKQALKAKELSQKDYNAQLKEMNAAYTGRMKEANATKSSMLKEANTFFTTSTKEANSFLAQQKAAIAAEQARLKSQFETQKKLSAQAQKEALANLAFERAAYTKADYDKKVAELKGDFSRINQGLTLSYQAVQGLPAERREEYLSGGIGSLAVAQEMLAKSREEAKAAPPKGAIITGSNAPVATTTPPVTVAPGTGQPEVTPEQPPAPPEIAPVRVPFEEIRQQARADVTQGIGSPIVATTSPTGAVGTPPPAPTAPATPMPSVTPGGVPNPYESIFGGREQFAYLDNPYISAMPGMSREPAPRPTSQLLFDPNYAPPTLGTQLSQQPQQLQNITGQTPAAQPVFGPSSLNQNNPYLMPYANIMQTALPPEEEQQVVRPTGMF